MSQRFVLFLVLGLMFIGAENVNAADIVGTVTRIEPGMVELKADDGQTRSVTVNEQTSYMKWITQKPWGRDLRANARLLTVGTRVHIDAGREDPTLARVIWIVVR